MKYFEMHEFECPCCLHQEMKPEFLILLDRCRHIAGIPFKINSGWRCSRRNSEVSGSVNSSHLVGWASDISCLGNDKREIIIRSAMASGFNRIGIAKTFIHLDCDPDKEEHLIWTY